MRVCGGDRIREREGVCVGHGGPVVGVAAVEGGVAARHVIDPWRGFPNQ